MKIKKMVSEKVLAANRANAQKSSGPNNRAAVKWNALRHGLLAKSVMFRNEEEAQFEWLLNELAEEFPPESVVDRMLIQEAGVNWWKIQGLDGSVLQEIRNQHKASKKLLRGFVENADEQLSLFSGEHDDPVIRSGWDCREVVLRTSSRKFKEEKLIVDKEERTRHAEMELRLGSSMETILRYQTALKRDLYRATQVLQARQDRGATGNASPALKILVRSAGHVCEGGFVKQSH